ncbi:MAG TPA: LPS export ABC transporter permease LptG [Aquabacterium sp.]|uniref:LPS export ABC transporter permease LptG n=1 Tax=Aquabacterium sp. TaxID=1872578 RepID=UPI002E358925|nr:LPS export ABC transporter permease LptG [Aquabacterium sp.]HEX5357635.1 LPS export ABC transporter permease LptG [Aquabacterium sp.]
MNTVRRLIFRSVISHVGFVTLAFSALFFFIDFVEELQDLGHRQYTLVDALWTCLFLQGAHFYDLFPIALLIGGILALARMAQTSEFTILRTGGLGPGRALGLLAVLGASAAMIMVFVGNWYVPWSEAQLALHRAKFSSRQGLNLGHGGTWLRERREVPGSGFHNITVNVGAANSQGEFGNVRIFEFDARGRLIRRLAADKVHVEALGNATTASGSIWHMENVLDTRWTSHDLVGEQAVLEGSKIIAETRQTTMDWQSSLTPLVVSASVLPPETMSTAALWRYTQHLATNAQAAQRYEIEFWKKTFYPLVCMVMVALALPFAYLHARSGGMSLKIFGGIMLGISFVLINHISSHLGLLHQWQPWLAAAAPSVIYLLLSMSAFIWLVRYR